MLKYKGIIEKLTLDQKLQIAASVRALAAPWAEKAGIPAVRVCDAEQIAGENGNPFPSFRALANSWNAQLAEETARELGRLARKDGGNLLITPRLGVQCSPFCDGVSEDPCLAGAYADATAAGAYSAGVLPCLSGYALNDRDIDALDTELNPRAVFEYILAPLRFMRKEKLPALAFSYDEQSGSYAQVNTSAVGRFLREQSGAEGLVLSEKAGICRDAECLTAGNILLDGDTDTLRSAFVGDERRQGGSQSTELDAAVDRAIGLAMACRAAQAEQGGKAADPTLALRAAEESVVLLKNSGILPLKQKSRLAVIGHPDGMSAGEFQDCIAEHGDFRTVGNAPGYLLGEERSDREIPHACRLAAKADAVLLFLRHDNAPDEGARRKTRAKFPPNRYALLDALVRINSNVIVILPADEPLDAFCGEKAAAMLIAETACARGGEALLNILSGKTAPSGRLASTLYADTDARFSAAAEEKRRGRIKIGNFLGYRNYDVGGEHVQYPFGFGLGYTSFSYSNLVVSGGVAVLTVRNRGKSDGFEVVQLYVGKNDSSVVRPRKELKAFQKVFLRAGESVRLTFRIAPESLAVYSNGMFTVEGGVYRVYVGSSVTDIRLEANLRIAGGKIAPDRESLCDYVNSFSNIFAGNYTLEPVKGPEKKSSKLLRRGVLLLLLSLLGETWIFVMTLIPGIDKIEALYFTILPIMFVFVFPALFLAAVILLIIGLTKRKRTVGPVSLSAGCQAAGKQITAEQPYEELFEDQFEREDAPEAPALPEWDEGVEALKYVDLSVSFASVCERFAAFAAERGLSLGLRGARKLLSAFCASQLIVLRGASTATAPRLAAILSEFFGSRPYLHELSPQERFGGGEIASGQLSDGSPALSNAVNAFRDAALNRHIVHVAAWISASAEQIAGAIRSYEAYFTHPERAGRAGRFESGSADCSALSPNVWFIFTLSGDSSGDESVKLPLACLVDVEFQAVDGSSAREPFEALNYYQLTALARTSGRDFCLDENTCWRKLDRLEQAVSDARSYRIDHGTWLRLERFSSAFLACGGEQADAFDCAVAAVLLPRMLAAPGQSAGELAHAFEDVFGSDYTPECKKVLAGSSAANPIGR